MTPRRVAVLGAGLSGLAAARRAQREGHFVRVFERSGRVGGVIQSDLRDGWLVEHGANTIQETPEVAQLIAELGLTGERVEANSTARNRFVVRGGKLVPLPLSPPQFLAGGFFSARTKLRILRELFRRPASRSDRADVSFADFIREHFGDEVLQYAAQPFVNGTYAGNPELLSARYAFPRLWASEARHGSLLRGQIAAGKDRKKAGLPGTPPLISFKAGMAALPAALADSLSPETLVLGSEVRGLTRAGCAWRLSGGGFWGDQEFDQVVITLPAPVAARLTVGGQAVFAMLAEITHPPVTALFAGFPSAAIRHPLNGFGCLVPSAERRSVLGILFSSSLFPNRAPAGHSALTIMLGGALEPAQAKPDAAEAWAVARADVQALLGINAPPVFLHAVHYPQAIPQYNLGYGKILSAITAAEAAHPGLTLAGSYRHGISVPNCLSKS